MDNLKEKNFEAAIEEWLLEHGDYQKGDPNLFDSAKALDTTTMLEFVRISQPKQWKRYATIYGAKAEQNLIARFCKEVEQNGLLRVLRQGISDRGVKLRFVFWKPETNINPDTIAQYQQNILHCTRQLHHSPKHPHDSLDMVLFINGIPVVTLELKSQFTGQSFKESMDQYRYDRSPGDPIFSFKNRALVNFCVDLYEVRMTTRLQGGKTFFLPLNQGSNGAGNVGGAGNPAPEDGSYQTAYLWQQVLCKERLLEILHKYMHYDSEGDKLIFPRYHQLDVVTKLLADVKENGSGQNYLIQHSAGSGKSNSIAWLAHRLSGLHNGENQKIFGSVIVVTDRKVLDSQLQENIYQFDHVDGVVQKIDKNSGQLRDAINEGRAIIITTLQKFPVIYKEVQADTKNYAIIVDEAHSSQTGEAAKKLKRALADTTKALEEYAELEALEEAATPDPEDKLVDELLSQGQHDNLSFFAFTATPKEKTLQMFGRPLPQGGFGAFHNYSMRQAIEEGFILDVLQNYTTYSMYYKVVQTATDNPEIETSEGTKAIKRYQSLHPHNISQKTAIMLRHIHEQTSKQIDGKAKAMVVTASRLHAVRYWLEFKKQIEQNGFKDVGVLVAFSGEVIDPDTKESYTEEKMNKDKEGNAVKEGQLPKVFKTGDFNVLVVAEKYQTGFDEPLLHTMFVDKKLTGVKAVQTLSRLNRKTQGKNDTFVLDFVNKPEDMQASFQPFYETTILSEETDPNMVYDMKNKLDDYRIYTTAEVDAFANLFYSGKLESHSDMGQLSVILRPALDRYAAQEAKDKDDFKSLLNKFTRLYSFITQICRLFDRDFQRFQVYAKFLLKILPAHDKDKADLDGKVLMEYYRLEKDFEGSIQLEKNSPGEVQPISGGVGKKEEKKETLAEIVERINERFGTSFTEMDKIGMQVKEDFCADETFKAFAKDNDEAMFDRIYPDTFKKILANRYQHNNDFFNKLFSDESFLQYFMSSMRGEIYSALRE